MRGPADIAVYDENGQIAMFVEVKAVPESSPEWAVDIRRQILEAAGFMPRYVLVVARDRAYLWMTPAPSEAKPDHSFKTDDLFQHYLDHIKSDSHTISSNALELMVGIWLSDMAAQVDRMAKTSAVEELGLRSAVANGRVEFLNAA